MNNKNIFKLDENNQNGSLEKHLRPQWSWKTFIFIILTIALLTLVTIDLEINFINLFTDSFLLSLGIMYQTQRDMECWVLNKMEQSKAS